MTVEMFAEWMRGWNLDPEWAGLLAPVVAVLCLLVLAFLANYLAKLFIARIVHPLIGRSEAGWENLVIKHNVLVRFSHLVPAFVIQVLGPTLFENRPEIAGFFSFVVNIYLIVIILLIIDAVLNATRTAWERRSVGARYPAKTFIQAAKLMINLFGGIFILATLMDKSPIVLFSGLGAVTAVLLLLFRDAILGLVAGFQLSINDMVSVGDWIEMPARDADGIVIDVSLTTVKVQNWDKTITTLPSYSLISESFKNWRGMSEAGGRRIKRALHIDVRTMAFVTEPDLERWRKIKLLRPYLEEKLEEIGVYNKDLSEAGEELVNGRRLTNVGTFRAYCFAYLRGHPKIRQDLTLLVRQREPEDRGLPIEIYAFSSDIAWGAYENLQSDIFDHLFSILPEFGLRAYQNPSGADLERIGGLLAPRSNA